MSILMMKKGQLDSLAVAELDGLRAKMASNDEKANRCWARRGALMHLLRGVDNEGAQQTRRQDA
jgi:hypothetical protein